MDTVISRKSVTTEDITQMVRLALVDFIAEGAPFSAWNVTSYLRTKNPDIEIAHGDIRWRVAAEMKSVVAGGYWTSAWNGTFITYAPASAPVDVEENEEDAEDEDTGEPE